MVYTGNVFNSRTDVLMATVSTRNLVTFSECG